MASEIAALQAELAERREQYRAVTWVYSLDSLRFLDVNDVALRVYGWTRDEFLAMSIVDAHGVAASRSGRVLEIALTVEKGAMDEGWPRPTPS